MKQNIFKSARVDDIPRERSYFRKRKSDDEIMRDERFSKLYGNKYNLNGGVKEDEKKKEEEVNIGEMFFPDLGTSIPTSKKEITTTMNYKEASKREVEHCNDDIIPEGWCVIYKNEDNEIIRENGLKPKKVNEKERQEKNNSSFSNVAKHLIYKWDKYKEDYIKLYGEDAYYEKYFDEYSNNENLDLYNSDYEEYSEYSDYDDYSDS